ncbi:hypothetical protein QBC45DRAFT_242573 [Copromyces sp. CBS 386.78]|nr:hypothetical protein QBC45DRAFT_242573 [Copromyces sp. CBS 386.78]
MSFVLGGGSNPAFGRDPGPPPPRTPRPGAFPPGSVPNPAGVPGVIPSMAVPAAPAYGFVAQQQPAVASPYYAAPAAAAPAWGTAMAATPSLFPQPYQYISGLGGSGRTPQPYPVINPNMPASNMTNSTGGVGCEPGYNYFFPPEHTKIHVFKCGATPPWHQPPNARLPFHACHVPVNTTVQELMYGFGACNPSKKKNKLFEVVQGGNGRWYRGLAFRGDDKELLQKTCKELGWDKSRSGLPGQKPVVYLYVTKD